MIEQKDILERFLYKDLEAITGGDSLVIQRAISSAVIWLKAVLSRIGATYDENDEYLREVAIKRTLYELYAYGQDWEIAKENKEEAEKLLEARYGKIFSEEKQYRPFAIGIVHGSEDWKGFK